jgi:anti-sigma regulatory factor (Ser/Thr protein kinase)
MALVELRFPPVAGHVRTARLVASAVARRCGFDEESMDGVRLAVGEACARAVRRSESCGVTTPVVLRIDDERPGLRVDVVDGSGAEPREEPVVLAIVEGLADRVELLAGPGGPDGHLRLVWFGVQDPLADDD